MAYTGIGDIVSGWAVWGGLRGYNATYCTGSNPCLDIIRASDSTTQTFNILSTGAVDVAGITSFLNATTGKCSKLYDQTGNVNHWIQATSANQPAVTLSAGGLGTNQVCLTFSGSQFLATTSNIGVRAQPWSLYAFAQRTGSLTTQQLIVDTLDSGSNDLAIVFWTDPEIILKGPSTVGSGSGTAADNAWHSIQGVANSTTSIIGIDGTSVTGLNAGTSGPDGTHKMGMGGSAVGGVLVGTMTAAGYLPAVLTTGNITAINSNDAYWFSAVPSGGSPTDDIAPRSGAIQSIILMRDKIGDLFKPRGLILPGEPEFAF